MCKQGEGLIKMRVILSEAYKKLGNSLGSDL